MFASDSCARQVLSLRNKAHGPAIDHTVNSAGQSQFGSWPASPVQILIVPLRTHSVSSALGPVPLGTVTCMSTNS